MKGSEKKNLILFSKSIDFIYQADFDTVHHELENVLLEALLAGWWQGEGNRRVGDRGRAAFIVGRLIARFG